MRPKIFCPYDKLLPEADLQLHPKNPNHHGPAQLRLYAKIIQANGWRRPVVVSKRSGYVTKGNGAVLAVRAAHLGPIPVNFQSYPSEAVELEDMLADNELARLAETDQAQLQSILKQFDSAGIDKELAGILAQLEKPVLKELKIKPPPKMAWLLVGIPIIHYGRLTPAMITISICLAD